MGAGAGARLAAVAVLLVLAAVSLHPAGRPAGSGVGVHGPALAVAALCGALAAAYGVAALRRLRGLRGLPPGPAGGRRRPQVLQQILTLALCAALLMSPAGSALLQRLDELISPSQRPVPTADRPQPEDSSNAGATRPPAPIPQAAALGAVLVLIGVLAAAAIRRRRVADAPASGEAADLSSVATAGIAALDADADEVDPRDRVIRAYAAMERVLAATGTARRPADTPSELLRRAQVSERVPGAPIARLTELFGRARFGRAPVGPGEVAEARACLRELQASAPGAPDLDATRSSP